MDKPTAISAPPTAEKRPYSYERHGVTIEDPWHWIRDQKYPQVEDKDVLSYLTAENEYFGHWQAEHKALLEQLFEEMKGRIKEDESSVPMREGDYLYWWAFKPGAQYRTWYRRRVAPPLDGEGSGRGDVSREDARASTVTPTQTLPHPGGGLSAHDEVIFDEPAEAEGKEFFRLGAMSISEDGSLMAYSTDLNGSERYTIRFRDLNVNRDVGEAISGASGKWGDVSIEGTIGNIVFTNDGSAILYGLVDEHWRTRTIKMHRLGTSPDEDTIVYHEEDAGFAVGVAKSTDKSLIFIAAGDNATSEVRFVSASDPTQPLTLVSPRKENRQYEVDAAHGKLWILANDDHVNFRLAEANPASPDEWRTVIPGSDRVYLRGVTSYRDHLAIQQRVDGLDQLILRTYDGDERRIPFAEASYSTAFLGNPEFAPDAYRLAYSSLVTPATVYDYHPQGDRLEELKVQEIPSGYDASKYETERLMITARDGTKVPVSVVYPKGFKKDGSGKLFLYAYGAYGIAIPPAFNTNRISLLDRGWAYAIAHIRGGDDLGYQWFLDGKLQKRTNTFNDFVDVAKGLIAEGFTHEGGIGINGGSAGGELMGAVVNSDPELWGAVVADVPFVDVLNTMLDDTLPLTPGEWPEWGNPIIDKAAFDTIRSYSPYDNIKAQDYPPMLITGGLTDPRVTYWEPAKWAAKLRANKTDDNLLLLKINMGAGHGGKSGRWERLHEVAETYGFVLTQVGE